MVLTSNEIIVKNKSQSINSVPETNTTSKKIKDYLLKNKAQSYQLLFTKNEASKLSNKIANIYITKFSKNTDINKIITDLEKLFEVDYAQPNYIYYLDNYELNDPFYLDIYKPGMKPDQRPDSNWSPAYDYQWNLKKIKLKEGIETIKNDNQLQEVKVAVIDTGVDYTHPEFGGCNEQQYLQNQCPQVLKGYNYIDDSENMYDDYGHGTHVAGTIAAISGNNQGIAAFHNKIKIVPFKICDKNGETTTEKLGESLYDVVMNRKVNIINLSLGGYSHEGDAVISDVITELYFKKDTSIIASAGNDDFRVEYHYPAAIKCIDSNKMEYDCVMTVGSTNNDDKKSSFSNWGYLIDITAPGGNSPKYIDDYTKDWSYLNIISLKSNYLDAIIPKKASNLIVKSNYLRLAGTSMAVPHVTGLVALIKLKYPKYTAEQIRNIILNSADDIMTPRFDIYSGFGRINVYKALTNPNPTLPPLVIITWPANKYISGNELTISGSAHGFGFDHYVLEYASDKEPNKWHHDGIIYPKGSRGNYPVDNNTLGIFNFNNLESGTYFIRISAYINHSLFQDTKTVYYDARIASSWPYIIKEQDLITYRHLKWRIAPLISDLNYDGKKEIIITTPNYISIFDSTGKPLPNWSNRFLSNYRYTKTKPYICSTIFELPVVADIDKKCQPKCTKEIILSYIYNETPSGIKIVPYTDAFDLQGNKIFHYATMLYSELNLERCGNPEDSLMYQPLIIEDLNNDNKEEIILIRNSAGLSNPKEIIILNSQLQQIGSFEIKRNNGVIIKKIAIADINNDNIKEIIIYYYHFAENYGVVIAQSDGKIISDYEMDMKYRIEGSGTGWPIQSFLIKINHNLPYYISSIWNYLSFNDPQSPHEMEGNIHIFNIMTGLTLDHFWPLSNSGYFVTRIEDPRTFAVADFNNDNNTDFLIYNKNPKIFDYKADIIAQSTKINEYIHINDNFKKDDQSVNQIPIGDIDNDGYKEFIRYRLNKDNTAEYIFYRVKNTEIEEGVYPSIKTIDAVEPHHHYTAIDDINNDGKTELIVIQNLYLDDIYYGYGVYVYKLGTKMGFLDWPQYLHDERHTEVYQPANITKPPTIMVP